MSPLSSSRLSSSLPVVETLTVTGGGGAGGVGSGVDTSPTPGGMNVTITGSNLGTDPQVLVGGAVAVFDAGLSMDPSQVCYYIFQSIFSLYSV